MKQRESIQMENRDNSRPDFRRVFADKLEAIKPIPEEERENYASGFESIGIKKLKKEAPALLINMPRDEEDEQAFELWVSDPALISRDDEPHDEVRQDLAIFLGLDESDSGFPKYPIGARLLQDDDNKLYLLVDEIRAKNLDWKMKDDQKRLRLLDLLQRYGITKVAGRFWRTRQEGSWTISGGETETIIDQDIIGERREDLRLLDIARRYDMTNAQYMRFRIRAKSAIDAVKNMGIKEQGIRILRNVEEIAKEVVDEDKAGTL